MKKLLRILLPLCAMLAFAAAANGQDKSNPSQSASDGRRNVAVIVVGSVAKGAWATTKFVAKDVAKPVAKMVFLKAAPKIIVFALKKSPVLAAKLTPTALKLALL